MPKQTYSFRLKQEIRDKLVAEAVAEHRSATNMLELILERRYEEQAKKSDAK